MDYFEIYKKTNIQQFFYGSYMKILYQRHKWFTMII